MWFSVAREPVDRRAAEWLRGAPWVWMQSRNPNMVGEQGVGCAPAEDVGRSPLCYACGGWVHPDTRGRSRADEPVRSLNDALKPKLYYAYDRCAGTYLMYAYVE